MSFVRKTGIPVLHTFCETAAIPFASEEAFGLGLTCLNPRLGSPDAALTTALWRGVEKNILISNPGVSIDQAVAIRDRLWFGAGDREEVSLGVVLRYIANLRLERRGAVAVPKPIASWERVSEAVQLPPAIHGRNVWRWLSLALPPDFLLATMGEGDDLPLEVETVPDTIARPLEEGGFAETHLHLGAAIDFPTLWVGIVHGLADYGLSLDAFASPGAAMNEGRLLGSWGLRAALARIVLADFLVNDQTGSNFNKYLWSIRPELGGRIGAGAAAVVFRGLGELSRGRLVSSANDWRGAMLQMAYRNLTGLGQRKITNNFENVYRADPLARYLPPMVSRGPSPEMRLIARSLAYIERTPKDKSFAILFWQLMRVRNLFYRHFVMRPMTFGLQPFIRHFGRLRPARQHLSSKLLLECALNVSGMGRGLRSLEVRTEPETSKSEFLTRIVAMDKHHGRIRRRVARGGGYARNATPELGVVLHFVKDRGGGARQGVPVAHGLESEGDPMARRNRSGYRYSNAYRKKREEALSFGWVLRRFPHSLEILRGLDIAGDELGMPNWVYAPLFRYVRECADVASRYLGATAPFIKAHLRTSVHAGEDFIHLMSGLRRVYEAVSYFGLRGGDRLGHAVALGIDARQWARDAGPLTLRLEYRLFDLLWEWQCYSEGLATCPNSRSIMLEAEIRRLARRIFGDLDTPLGPNELVEFVKSLHTERRLRAVRFPDGPFPLNFRNKTDRLLHLYLTNPEVFRRCATIELVDPYTEGEVLYQLQLSLRRLVGTRGIMVEMNPSSNLLIGNLTDLSEHPFWRLKPPRDALDESFPLSVCIGSDDPIVFATTLRGEYALLHDAIIRGGLRADEADRWTDEIRRAGLEGRFTVPRSPFDIRRPFLFWRNAEVFQIL